jgi:hypothetical protein
MKTHVTLILDADLLREARVLAAEEGRSISALLTDRWNRWCASERRSTRHADSAKESICSRRHPRPATRYLSVKYFVGMNILLYAHDTSAGAKHERAKALIEALWREHEPKTSEHQKRRWLNS